MDTVWVSSEVPSRFFSSGFISLTLVAFHGEAGQKLQGSEAPSCKPPPSGPAVNRAADHPRSELGGAPHHQRRQKQDD